MLLLGVSSGFPSDFGVGGVFCCLLTYIAWWVLLGSSVDTGLGYGDVSISLG